MLLCCLILTLCVCGGFWVLFVCWCLALVCLCCLGWLLFVGGCLFWILLGCCLDFVCGVVDLACWDCGFVGLFVYLLCLT